MDPPKPTSLFQQVCPITRNPSSTVGGRLYGDLPAVYGDRRLHGGIVVESEITLSPEVARDAARFFFWHRNLTRFGLMILGSLAVLTIFAAVIYPYQDLRFALGAR